MLLTLDESGRVPPFEQIRAQVSAAVDSGQLAAGTRLPTVRRLAADLGVAVNTVARAYRELEIDGVVVSRGRHGTFVRTAAADAQGVEQAAVAAARAFVRAARDVGMSDAQITQVIDQALRAAP